VGITVVVVVDRASHYQPRRCDTIPYVHSTSAQPHLSITTPFCLLIRTIVILSIVVVSDLLPIFRRGVDTNARLFLCDGKGSLAMQDRSPRASSD
jgi:hypothetical protein